MAAVRLAALREAKQAERRVAIVPEVAARLIRDGYEVLVEAGAGERAFFPDQAYADVGVKVTSRAEAIAQADILAVVNQPDSQLIGALKSGQVIVGLLGTRTDPAIADALAAPGATALDLAFLPRTLSRTQTMDALSSQASVAGYRAGIVAAGAFGRYMPMMITAAGTAKPAKVIVLGTGVAGLQAIGTTKRLGAVVTGYDVRPASRTEVESLGATFLAPSGLEDGAGQGGYARELTPEEQAAQRAELGEHIVAQDIVITTAQVPGRKPPVLVTADVVARMKPGSVIVDLGASALGGNVEGSKPGETVLTDGGVTILDGSNLAAEMPTGASSAYARNVMSLLAALVRDGQIVVDLEDEVLDAIVVAHGGSARKGK
ncbi:MAG: NAD(P) transhydrogenase subunit alpha [Bifidobacteriaceae bacterium]|jgi:NAD(P) transhydrogenase subunit alpha|nr:NAD(P) transhydrogenase subunit alpha [Bifidobacteriaceae bacterium]